jgi:inorganic triphosphatase YgiF
MTTTSVTVARETERKYEASDEVTLSNPAESLGLACAAVEEQVLAAVYFDTADLRLLRAGITLRRREGGDDAGWHLKLRAGEDSRDELRLPLDSGDRQPPAKLVELIQGLTNGAALEPVAELTTHRRRWRLADADGPEVANLVDDRVIAHTMGEPQKTERWREIDVELAGHGDTELLDRTEKWLLELGARRSASTSKLGRLLADRLPPPSNPGDRSRSGSAGAVVLAYRGAQCQALRRYNPMVRQDAPDAVHQLRVAARRMRSALQAFGRVIERDRTRSLTDELKWVAGELAEARDTEVMAQRFTALLSQLPDEARLGPVQAQIDQVFARRYAQARQRALTALNTSRYRALLGAIDALLADPPLTEHARLPAKRELPRTILRVYRRTSRAMAQAQALPPARAATWHCTTRARPLSGCATPWRRPSPPLANPQSGSADDWKRYRTCLASTRTRWWPGPCCVNSPYKHSARAATASPMASCTPPTTTVPDGPNAHYPEPGTSCANPRSSLG